MHTPTTAAPRLLAALALALSLQATAQAAKPDAAPTRKAAAKVDGASIRANAAHTRDWPTIGLDHAETRFSKLVHVNAGNVKDLGLVWSYNLESTRGVEATASFLLGLCKPCACPWSAVGGSAVRNLARDLPRFQDEPTSGPAD